MKRGFWIVLGFLLLGLACGLPHEQLAPTPTPVVYVTVLVATPTSDVVPVESITPSPVATEVLSQTGTVTATMTVTPTGTPKKSHPALTATPVPLGPPLGFADPAWIFVEWHPIPDTGDYEGTIALNVVGGTPPYRSQLEDQPVVSGVNVPVRWRLCQPMPATVRVWSADGQRAETKIWVWEVGCKQ